MYLGLHYPTSGGAEGIQPILPHSNSPVHGLRFPQRVASMMILLNPKISNKRALDMGCAVGGSSFELAKTFDHVDAFDFSKSFVDAAIRMKNLEEVHFKIPVEAELYEEVKAVHEPDITPAILSRVNFFTGDACKLPDLARDNLIGTYDGVIMSNLLCRLPDPMACLDGLSAIVNKGGVVLLVTPFSWLTEFTPRDKWMGGYHSNEMKAPIESKDILKASMEERGFEKIHEEQMPLVIREHQRKYQYIVSEATGWRKL